MTRKAPKIKRKRCKWCEKPIWVKNPKQIYCDVDCKTAYHNSKKPIKGHRVGDIIDCGICGDPFPAGSSGAKYCGDDCRLTARRLEYNAKKRVGEIINCGVCEKPFPKTGGNSKYCPDCAIVLHKRKGALQKKWREAVLKRDSYKCRKCGSKKNLEAHHIKGYRDFPELRMVVSNGITLCAHCHDRTHGRKPRDLGYKQKVKALEDAMAPKNIVTKTVDKGIKWVVKQLSIFD